MSCRPPSQSRNLFVAGRHAGQPHQYSIGLQCILVIICKRRIGKGPGLLRASTTGSGLWQMTALIRCTASRRPWPAADGHGHVCAPHSAHSCGPRCEQQYLRTLKMLSPQTEPIMCAAPTCAVSRTCLHPVLTSSHGDVPCRGSVVKLLRFIFSSVREVLRKSGSGARVWTQSSEVVHINSLVGFSEVPGTLYIKLT